MKLPDANVLIYAVDAGSKRHGAAREWLETTLSGTETIGFAWSVLHAFVRLTTSAQVFGALTTDAHLAALAIEHGAELCSADADFSRFPGLRWMNPLAA